MKKEFVMRGKTASGGTNLLEFGGRQKENKNMAYRLVEFQLYPSVNILAQAYEMCGSITATKTAIAPTDLDFDNMGLIGTALVTSSGSQPADVDALVVINDTFMITNNLILMVQDTHGNPINWQCRFEAVKMTDAETAATNFKQYSIFDE